VVGTLDRPGAAPLERPGGTGVRAQTPPARRRLVHRVAHHRVAEGEQSRRAGRPCQGARQQLVERRQPRRLGELRQLGGQPDLERIAGDGRPVKSRRASGVSAASSSARAAASAEGTDRSAAMPGSTRAPWLARASCSR
jgi:hypothetical protein